jgi:hypothetical protein
MISGFRCKVEKNCSLLCYYATSSGNFLPTFRVNVFKYVSRLGPIGCTEMSVRNHNSSLYINPEQLISEDIEFTLIYFDLDVLYVFIYFVFNYVSIFCSLSRVSICSLLTNILTHADIR